MRKGENMTFENKWKLLLRWIESEESKGQNLLNQLPEDLAERARFLTHINHTTLDAGYGVRDVVRSILDSCITAKRVYFFTQALELGAKLTEKEFGTILISSSLSLEDRKQFFAVSIEHIYAQSQDIRSLDDELFGHIYRIESYLTVSKKREFRNHLMDIGFPEEFRPKIASVLHNAGIEHEAFIEKLRDFADRRSENLTISPEAKEYYRVELNRLAGRAEAKDDGAEDKKYSKLSEHRGSDSTLIVDSDSSNGSREHSDEKDGSANPMVATGLRQRKVTAREQIYQAKEEGDISSKETDSLLLDRNRSNTMHQDKIAQEKSSGGLLGWLFGNGK